jgi:hypothetical protein
MLTIQQSFDGTIYDNGKKLWTSVVSVDPKLTTNYVEKALQKALAAIEKLSRAKSSTVSLRHNNHKLSAS